MKPLNSPCLNIPPDEVYNKTCTEAQFKSTTWNDATKYTKFISDFISFSNSNYSASYYDSAANITDTLKWETVRDFDGFSDCKISYESPSEQYWS